MEYGWLIESAIHSPEGVHYLCARKLGKWDLEWLPGADKALRFARQQDADAMIELTRELCPDLFPRVVPMPRSVEHVWEGAAA